jgi:DNA/RNA-binding domain of Phe-tRNA-synthetase-like protein
VVRTDRAEHAERAEPPLGHHGEPGHRQQADAHQPDRGEHEHHDKESLANGRAELFGEESDHIASWHEAYRAFGTNPRRMRPSVDALLRRVRTSGALPSISPAVDVYNSVSVLWGLPAGAFDRDRVTGDIEIRHAREGDMFEPLGEPDEWEAARAGDVVYADRKPSWRGTGTTATATGRCCGPTAGTPCSCWSA